MSFSDTKSENETRSPYVVLETSSETSPRLRLEFLDGMRGLAALYVVVGHSVLLVTSRMSVALHWQYDSHMFPTLMQTCLHSLELGHYAVALFIVLSGYCLMMPVVRSKNDELSGGIGGYLKRRAWRILPPYYATLVVSLILMVGMSESRSPNDEWRQMMLPLYTPGTLISHLLLVHNLREDWIFKINGALWSVATEWQIYFVFAFALLPFWRRFGIIATLIVSFAIGLTPHFLLHQRFDAACPWFVGLFAMGMSGASVTFGSRQVEVTLRERMPWGTLATSGFIVLLVITAKSALIGSRPWAADILMGLVSVCTILGCARTAMRRPIQPTIALNIFDSRPAVALGRFSYSLYLVHVPVLIFARYHILAFLEPSPALLGILLLGVVPISVGLAYLFYLVFERRFTSVPQRVPSSAVSAGTH